MKDSVRILVIWQNKFLLFHRDNIPAIPHPDCWTLVGGGIEEGETPPEAMQRELVEEASYSPKNLQYLGVRRIPDGRYWHLFFAFVGNSEGKLFKKGTEGQGIGFFTYKETLKLKLSPLLRNNFPRLKQMLEKIIKEKKIPKIEEISVKF